MVDIKKHSLDAFLSCDWKFDVDTEHNFGYSSLMSSLENLAKEKLSDKKDNQAAILSLLSKASSMMLTPGSINQPFKPFIQDFQAGKRSAMPEDFTSDELAFFEETLDHLEEPLLKARIADLLWLRSKPRKVDHARIAVDIYLSFPIDPEAWRRDINKYWERAGRLAIQIRDSERIDLIKSELYSAFTLEYANSEYMTLWLADLFDRLQLDHDYRSNIAARLSILGKKFKEDQEYSKARSYLLIAEKKFKQLGDENGLIDSLVCTAVCFEEEAEQSAMSSDLIANGFYENAINAYRKIPTKHRGKYKVDEKIRSLREKKLSSGKSSLDEMQSFSSPKEDISEIVDASVDFVSGNPSVETAILAFTRLFSGLNLSNLKDGAKTSLDSSPLHSLFGCTHYGADGRVVAKTPPADSHSSEDNSANKAVLHSQMMQHAKIEIELVVKGRLIPALNQILKEHHVFSRLLVSMCEQSPLVPENRGELIGKALWYGFDYDFGTAIYLLCPQLEHIVRTELKQVGASTINIDQDGIENENGLSSLMELPEIEQVFDENLIFEIKTIFTDSLGFNLRNEAAHGLLDDRSANSVSAIYAWWMILRLIIFSILGSNGQAKSEEESTPEDAVSDATDPEQECEYKFEDVTSGAFSQIVVRKNNEVVFRSEMLLTDSEKHRIKKVELQNRYSP